MIDQKLIGKTYGPNAYDIDEDEVEAFLEATDEENPVYETSGSPVPPMFAVVYARDVVAACMFDEELDLNLPMLVHGEQDFEFLEHAYVGDTITTTGRLAEWTTRGDNEVVRLKTASRNQDEELVCRGAWTFIIRGGGEA